jgi:hypothetical protein
MDRHPVDLISLVAGSVFLGIGLLLISGGLTSLPMDWVGPMVAIGLGVVILVAAWTGSRDAGGKPVSSNEE